MKIKPNNQVNNQMWIFVFLFLSSATTAKTITWTGAVSNSWNNSANWCSKTSSGIPTVNDNILIASSPNQPVMDLDVTVASLTVDGNGKLSVLKLDGIHDLIVTGNIKIVNSATDKVISSSSTITISNGGNLSGAGEIDLSGNGKLYISGDLSIADVKADKSTGSRVVFNGESQTISNGNEYHFNDLDIQQGYTTLMHTNLRIDGNLIGGGTLNGENNKIRLAGDMMLVDYKPGTSTFVLASGELGTASVQQLNANSFYILENYNQKTVLTGRIKIIHQVDFEKGNIFLGYHNIYLSKKAKLTRGADTLLSQLQSGSRGYFISDGTGTLKLSGHYLFSKKVSPELSQNMATEIGLVESK